MCNVFNVQNFYLIRKMASTVNNSMYTIIDM